MSLFRWRAWPLARQVALAGVVSLAAVAAISTFGWIESERAGSALDPALEHAIPASRALGAVELLNRQSGSAAVQLAGRRDGRVERLPAVGSQLQQLPEAWAEFKRASLHLPGEKELVRDFDRRHQTFLSGSFKYVSAGTIASPAALAGFQRSLRIQQTDLDQLRGLYLREIASATAARTTAPSAPAGRWCSSPPAWGS